MHSAGTAPTGPQVPANRLLTASICQILLFQRPVTALHDRLIHFLSLTPGPIIFPQSLPAPS